MAENVLNIQALRAFREERGWDQQTLAERAGVDPSVISRLERGIQEDVRASVLVALARALQTPVSSLLRESLQPSSLEAELSATVASLRHLPQAHQRQVAAILRAYLAAMPEPSDADR